MEFQNKTVVEGKIVQGEIINRVFHIKMERESLDAFELTVLIHELQQIQNKIDGK